MAKQRYISTSFWDDEWIQELDPSEKLLYLYLMTNPLTNICGVYKLTDRRISFDTGFNIDTIRYIFAKFEKAKKAFRYGEYVVLPSWPQHQEYKKRKTIRLGIISQLQEIPSDLLDFLKTVNYRFDLSEVHSRTVETKARVGISGTTAKKVREKHGASCVVCNTTDNIRVRHIVPISDGGDNSIDNLTLLCDDCYKKHQKEALVQIPHEDIEGLEPQSIYDTSYIDTDIDTDIDNDSDTDDAGYFEMFWDAYPRKVGKKPAEKAFSKLKLTEELFDRIMGALEDHKASAQWTRDNGQFIPYPATWVNQERWNDELDGNSTGGGIEALGLNLVTDKDREEWRRRG